MREQEAREQIEVIDPPSIPYMPRGPLPIVLVLAGAGLAVRVGLAQQGAGAHEGGAGFAAGGADWRAEFDGRAEAADLACRAVAAAVAGEVDGSAAIGCRAGARARDVEAADLAALAVVIVVALHAG